MPHLLDHVATGVVTPSPHFENYDSIFITSSFSTVNNNDIGYQIINFFELSHIITCDTHLADCKILTPEQIKHLQPVDPAMLAFMIQHEGTTEIYINEFLKVPPQNPDLDCSQAYHCLQMADHRSSEMLAFIFASRTFAYQSLAEGFTRALSAFSSIMREYLDKVLKADQCAQYVDDIGIAANDADHHIANLRATFNCIQEAGLKLTLHKCHFDATEIDFLAEPLPHKA